MKNTEADGNLYGPPVKAATGNLTGLQTIQKQIIEQGWMAPFSGGDCLNYSQVI
jgi:hypothetical protein